MANEIDTGLMTQLGLAREQTKKDAKGLGQDDFLKLMITQMRNQDPFKPMDSSQFLGQLAQFGTVNGITSMQKSLSDLTSAVRGSQTLQAASLVDRHVLVKSREAWLPPDGSLQAQVSIPDEASGVGVSVYDLHGQLIAELPVDGDADGSIEWNGLLADGERAAPGFYELRASGRIDGKQTELDTLVAGRVESVSKKSAGDDLQLTVTGLGVVDLQDVRSIE